MRNTRHSVVLLVALTLGMAASAVAEGPAATSTRTVLIFDASGSMWGQIEGRSKIAIARDVIGELMGSWRAEDALGLTAYGHRRRGDCSDIERLVPLASGSNASLLEAVNRITPKGKTPIGAAVEFAAEELDYRNAPATVILVSDGKETCHVDPCEIAAKLEKNAIDFTAHVIGFDVTPEEHAGLSCIASATGGIFVAARDAAELRDAVQRVFEQAAGATTPGLWLGAALAEQRELIGGSVHWEIYRATTDGTAAPPVHVADSPTLFLTPHSGSYRAVAEFDGMRGHARFDYDEGTSQRHVVGLGAGRLLVSAGSGPYDAALDSEIDFKVFDGSREVAGSDRVRDTFVLPAGYYRIEATHDGFTQIRNVELGAGQEVRQRFRFGSGQLALRAVLSGGSPQIESPLHWEIRRADRDDRVEREPLEAHDKATLLLGLGSGRYEVTVRYGDAAARRLIELEPGTIQNHTIDLAAGRAEVFASLPPPGGPIQEAVHWRVFPLGAERLAPIAELRASSHSFVLPAGRYRVSGSFDGLTGSKDIEVRSGKSEALGVVLH